MIEHGEIFDPTPQYRRGLEILFDGIFQAADELMQEGGLHYSYRNWSRGPVVYSAVQTTRLNEEGVGRFVVLLARCQPEEGDLFDFRTYLYENGRLQVTNDVLTPDQLMAYISDPTVRDAVASQRGAEYAQGGFTPSEVEYHDFLQDLETFSQTR